MEPQAVTSSLLLYLAIIDACLSIKVSWSLMPFTGTSVTLGSVVWNSYHLIRCKEVVSLNPAVCYNNSAGQGSAP